VRLAPGDVADWRQQAGHAPLLCAAAALRPNFDGVGVADQSAHRQKYALLQSVNAVCHL